MSSASEKQKMRVGLIAVKNTAEEQRWLLSFLKNVDGEVYRRGESYDLVWFLNVTQELRFIKQHTDIKVMVVGMEPEFMYPLNYDSELLSLSDRYMGYRNFASSAFQGQFEPYAFPVYPRDRIRAEFARSMQSKRDHDFCIFATHDPNIRRELGRIAGQHRSILAGPLFENRVPDKLAVQRRCRYELITENDLNDYYFSEKIGQALVAGCVPVYWGCTRIKENVPADLFIDMNDYQTAQGTLDIEKVIQYCITPGVYEMCFNAIQIKALEVLVNRFSIEGCLIEPFQRFVDEEDRAGWRSKMYSSAWKYWRLRSKIKGVLKTI